jgi:hypothetical protein
MAGALDAEDIGHLTTPTPAPWLSTHPTATADYYGFIDQNDTCSDNHYNRAKAAWTAIGMTPSPPDTVNQGSYAGSHQLDYLAPASAPCDCTTTCNPHMHVADDESLFGNVWDYMVGTL